MNFITRWRAYALLQRGTHLKKLFKLIKPHIKRNDPDALYIYSCFTLPEWREDEAKFNKRRIKYLHKAADAGFINAFYELGLHYHTGQGAEKDRVKAAQLFQIAAEKGHDISKLYYGLDLFYGSYGIEKNEDLGIIFVQQAADANVKDAKLTVKKLLTVKEGGEMP